MALDILSDNDLGKRGRGDGKFVQQFYGLLSQISIADYLKIRCEFTGGFDNGIDLNIPEDNTLELPGGTYDIKTQIRNCLKVYPTYACNVLATQYDSPLYMNERYLFATYHKNINKINIHGHITKSRFGEIKKYVPGGNGSMKMDGTYYITEEPRYECLMRDLCPVQQVVRKGVQ